MPKITPPSILTLACKSVIRKLFRNSVLIMAVSMLVALLAFAMLFNKAVKDDLEAANKRLGADLVLVPVEAMDRAEEFILESKEKTFYMDGKVWDVVRQVPGVAAATYQIYLNTLASGCCSIVGGQVIAFDPETDFIVKSWLDDPPPLHKGEVYIGSYVYEYLGLIDKPKLFGKEVKVVAHLQKSGTGLDHAIFIRRRDLAQLSEDALGDYKQGKLSIVFVKLEEGADIDQVAGELQSRLPTIGIMTRGTIGADVRQTLADIISIFSITIVISSVLSVLLAWSTFTAMTNERRRDVGILRAIGAHRGHIVKLFLAEALIISLIGGLLGVAAGHYLINHLAGNFHLLTELEAAAGFSPQNLVISGIAMAVGMGVCLIGALAPVVRLARMEPLLAIKEE